MIVCSCNVLSDHDVRAALAAGKAVPRTTGQVYRCLGCSVQCGRCSRTIRLIIDETLAVADSAFPQRSGSQLLRERTGPASFRRQKRAL